MTYAYINTIIWASIFVLSFIEASIFIDVHHDYLMLLDAFLLSSGKIPYIDYYEQYGILQPILVGFLFKIFGYKLAVQSAFFATIYASLVVNIGRIITRLTSDLSGLLAAGLIFWIGPYTQFPWPNYLMGFLISMGLLLYFKWKNQESLITLFLSLFLFSLTALVRSNSGFILPIAYSLFLFITVASLRSSKYIIAWFLALTPVFVAAALFFSSDYVAQAITLPKELLLPYFFYLPSSIPHILFLHFDLFFLRFPLASIVTPTPFLYLWRCILLIGLMLSVAIISKKIAWRGDSNTQKTCVLLTLVGVSVSSTVFPIFDGFRALCAWFSFFILIYVSAFYFFERRVFIAIVIALNFIFCGINLVSEQSIYKMISAYELNYLRLQFVDFTKYREIRQYNTEIYRNGPSAAMSKKHINGGVGPDLDHDKFYEVISKNCKDKKFLSYLPDFSIYFLLDDFQNNLAHKIFMGHFYKDKNGLDIDAFSKIYPDYFKILKSQSNLCLLLPVSAPSFFIEEVGSFNKIIELPNSKLYIR